MLHDATARGVLAQQRLACSSVLVDTWVAQVLRCGLVRARAARSVQLFQQHRLLMHKQGHRGCDGEFWSSSGCVMHSGVRDGCSGDSTVCSVCMLECCGGCRHFVKVTSSCAFTMLPGLTDEMVAALACSC